MTTTQAPQNTSTGTEHWTNKGDVRLFLWEKLLRRRPRSAGPSCSSTAPRWPRRRPSTCRCRAAPTVPVMDVFAGAGSIRGAWTWKAMAAPTSTATSRPTSPTAPTTSPPPPPISRTTRNSGPLLVYGISSGALQRGAVRAAPSRARRAPGARRLRLDRRGQPDAGPAAQEAAAIPGEEPPADRPRLRPLASSTATIPAPPTTRRSRPSPTPSSRSTTACRTAPISTCARTCRWWTRQRITVPTIVMRGEYDGIAGFDDLLEFFRALPNPDKQFAVMPGIAHASFQQKNHALVLPHPRLLLRAAGTRLSRH